jgi:hypothetical protein
MITDVRGAGTKFDMVVFYVWDYPDGKTAVLGPSYFWAFNYWAVFEEPFRVDSLHQVSS